MDADFIFRLFGLAIVAWGFATAGMFVFWLFRYVAVGRTDRRTHLDELRPRVTGFLTYVLGQSRVIREFGGFLHFFIFWGFLVLQVETIEYFIRGVIDDFRFSMIIGDVAYNGILFVQDVFGLLVVFTAICIAAVRRYVIRPDHVLPSKDAAVILALIGGLMVTKFFAHGAEIAHSPDMEHLGWNPAFTPVATLTSYFFGGPYQSTGSGALVWVYSLMYVGHVGIVGFFSQYIPRGKHLHLLGAMPNIFFRRLDPNGALYLEPKVVASMEGTADDEDEDAFRFGAGKLEDLTWKQLLDTYACTECGRCEHYCPAFNTGKELNPMMVIHKLKDHIKDKGEKVLKLKQDVEFPPLAGGIISKEELMACTTCGACVANCPVFIEHVDTIVDMRRYLVMTESDMSSEVATTFKNMENSSNPWGISGSKRADWADGLDIPLMSECETTPEYLFYVGCAGSFDDRAKKVTIALSKILNAAGVDYAILGPEEGCTGDAARRIGNEYLYYTMATSNIETLNGYNVTKIITTCPHCFHTIGKEYPQLGGDYEVIHHTKLLNELLRDNRLQLSPRTKRNVVYHDSCYIGRWNSDYKNPRQTLDQLPGVSVSEMEWNERKALCCGAGGGQMWMEEHAGKRVNMHRTDMALATDADTLVVNCPFCMTMLTDGLAQRESDMPAMDLAEVVAESLVEAGAEAAADAPVDAAE